MPDKLIAINTDDPHGAQLPDVVNDEIEFLVGQLGGVAGPAGPTGPAGPAGAKGDTGAVGPAGPAGADGAPGATGPQGDPGPAGADGAPGADGAVGPAGPVGPTGPAGADGAKGDQGIQGEPGIQGIQGEQGAPGLGITYMGTIATIDDLPTTATQGDLYVVEDPAPATSWIWDDEDQAFVEGGPVQGPQGVPGPQGIPGPAGPAGNDGVAGAVGPAGPAGPKGDTGPQGPKGDPGDASGVTGFLPTAGGEMTGAITLPSGVNGLTIKGTSYNMLGGSGGVAYRNGTSNIINFTGGEVAAYVPITTAGSGVGVKFGSGGPTLSKAGTTIASSAPITVAAAPAADTELANKAYVDSKAGSGGVTNPVSGSVSGLTLWLGSQAAYDAIPTKDAKTVYYLV